MRRILHVHEFNRFTCFYQQVQFGRTKYGRTTQGLLISVCAQVDNFLVVPLFGSTYNEELEKMYRLHCVIVHGVKERLLHNSFLTSKDRLPKELRALTLKQKI